MAAGSPIEIPQPSASPKPTSASLGEVRGSEGSDLRSVEEEGEEEGEEEEEGEGSTWPGQLLLVVPVVCMADPGRPQLKQTARRPSDR